MWPRIALGAIGALLFRFGGGVFSRLWFIARQLWHELIGVIFVVLALSGGSAALREWAQHGLGARFLIAVCFTVMMLYFGVTSFRSAKNVRASGN